MPDTQHISVKGNQVKTVAIVDFYTGEPVGNVNSDGSSSSDTTAANQVIANTQLQTLNSKIGKLSTPYNITLPVGNTTTPELMQSLMVINEVGSPGNITVSCSGTSTVILPGEAVGWEASVGGTLEQMVIVVPSDGTAGRLFGTHVVGG